ncbi:hypothetical protein Pla52n_38630 [Stieleria varia]|uniref:TadE-like domain-containing protein n=2 Tax=Stieleria varia TaxID=2528005 RepID=A0A5C6ARZ8_9BACT|nr:hypothetical protein Pla52n_38630 [Stieleria varia]
MLIFAFGLIEISRLAMVKESITQATREGARVGIRPTATAADITTRINEELEILGITGAMIEIEPSQFGPADEGETVRVRIRVPMANITWIPDFFDFNVADVSAETVMRRESTS